MIEFFLDESGSMTKEYAHQNPYFVICMLKVNDKDQLKRAYKYFIRKYHKELKSIDTNNKMFNNNKFLELKGSALTPEMKKLFINHFCQYNSFELFYITIDNNKLTDEKIFRNTARAFNYFVKLALTHCIHKKKLPKNEKYYFQIDERNQKTGSKNTMKDYLNTALGLDEKLVDEIGISYFDSSDNHLIQIADVFSNIKFSHLVSNHYNNEFKFLNKNKFITCDFKFPL